MSGEPLYLTILREGNTIVADLAEVAPVVPRSRFHIEESLLRDINDDLAHITTMDNAQVRLGTSQRTATSNRFGEELQRLGGLIFSHLFPSAIRERLIDSAPTDLFLRIDDQLVHVPWELAFDGSSFLLNKFRIGRHVLTHQPTPSPQPQPLPLSSRLSMRIVVDPTETLAATVQEAEQLAELLSACDNLDISVMVGKQLRKIDLLHTMNEYDVVHYAGHAQFDAENPSRSGWILHDSILTAAELRRVQHPPILVFSNACQAGATARWHSETAYDGQSFGIGSAFLLAGTQNYIGAFCPIHDAHSATFAADFYRHLLEGASIGHALAAARQLAFQEADVSGLLWASYMHYGNPTYRLPLLQPDESEIHPAEPERPIEPPITVESTKESEPRYQPLPAEARSPVAEIIPDVKSEPAAPFSTDRAEPAPPTPQPRTEPDPPAPQSGSVAPPVETSPPSTDSPESQKPRPRPLVKAGVGGLVLLIAVTAGVVYTGSSKKPLQEQAYAALEQGDWARAESMFQQLRNDPTPTIQSQGYAGLAAVAYAQNKGKEVLDLQKNAEALDAQYGYPHFLCGQAAVEWSRGAAQKAASYLRRLPSNVFHLPYCKQLYDRSQTP